MNYGREDWLRILLMAVQNQADQLTPYQVIQVLYQLSGPFFMSTMSEPQSKSALIFLNKAMENLDRVTAIDLKIIINTLYRYEIPEKAYYELLAVTLQRFMKEYNILEKANILYQLMQVELDEGYILNSTEETLREFLAVIMNNQELNHNGELDTLQLKLEGFMTEGQILYLEDLYRKNFKQVKESEQILKIVDEEQQEKAIWHLKANFSSYAKILWWYLIHSSDFIRAGQHQFVDYNLIGSSIQAINLLANRLGEFGQVEMLTEDQELIADINKSLNLRFYDLTDEKQITIPENITFKAREE